MRTRSTRLLALVLLACGLPAWADGDDPAARARRVAAGFPAPSPAHAFEASCYVLRAGAPHGRLTLSARPDEVDGVPVWRVRDVIKPLAAGGDRVELEAVLDARLACVSGSYHRRNAQGFMRTTWRRTADGGGYAFDTLTTEYENRLEVPADTAALSGLSGLLLFLRLAPAEAGRFVLPELDPNPAGGDPLVMPARIDVHRVAPWRVAGETQDAWIVSFTRGKQSARLALGAQGRAFLGMTFRGLPFMFVPEGSGPVGLADPAQPGVETPMEQAIERTRALRAGLPPPASTFAFEGDLRLGSTLVGSVRLSAVPASFEGQPAWEVTESRRTRTGEAEVVHELTGYIGRDLATQRGERRIVRPSGSGISTFVRKGELMETVNTADGKRGAPIQAAAPAGAVTGFVPVLLFLRQVPREPALYVLPGWDPRWARPPKAGSGSLASNAADVYVEVKGAAELELAGRRTPSWMARCSQRTGEVYEVHLDPQDGKLLGVVGRMPQLTIAPKGLPGYPVTWYDAAEADVPPKSARQAFVKFGRGYHLPRRDLLAEAFHWPSMLAVAVQRERYAKGTAEEVVRRDWIDVFVKMSKHRTAADCDDLLFQMFMTSRETHDADGSVSLATLPAYGGHTYRMREIDGRWYIVQID